MTRDPYSTPEHLRPENRVEAARDELAHDPQALDRLLAEFRQDGWIGFGGVTS